MHLKGERSKTDQLGKGVDVYMGKTGYPLCPVMATMAYMAAQGSDEGLFFTYQTVFHNKIRAGLQAVCFPESNFAGHT